MERFSLFDFLSFILPGMTGILLLYWVGGASHIIQLNISGYPNEIVLLGSIVPSYFLGLLFNVVTIDKGKSDAIDGIVQVFKNRKELAGDLNRISKKVFDLDFLTGVDQNEKLDKNKVVEFIEMAYGTLALNGHVGLINILFSQYKFLVNLVPLSYLAIICSAIVAFQELMNRKFSLQPFLLSTHLTEALIIIISSVIVLIVSPRIAKRRNYIKVELTLRNFKTYYILKTKNLLQENPHTETKS
jgi:hypothetical protein